MDKPQKPSDLLPNSFGGEKEAFSEKKISAGYEPDVPDVLSGANLNYMINAIGQNLDYNNKITDFINELPINNVVTVDANNKLVYKNSDEFLAFGDNKANIDLDNLSAEGIAKLNEGKIPIGSIFPCVCSDGWTPENSLPCNGLEYSKSLFPDLWKDYLTSGVFNSSSFVIGGNLNLTNNGIVSGFLGDNKYVKTADSFNFSEAETWEITTPAFSVETFTDSNWILSGSETGNTIRLIIRSTGKINFGIWEKQSSDITDVLFSTETAVLIENNKNYIAKIGFDGSMYYLKLSVNGGDFEKVYQFATETKITYNPICYFGKMTTYAASDVTMDLKEFAVTVDGKEVINGSISRLATCTYEQYASDIEAYGQCAKFAVDKENEIFKVPLIKDGAYITQALTAEEIGKSYNESLPNITGVFTTSRMNEISVVSGAFSVATENTGSTSGEGNYGYYCSFDASRSSKTYKTGAKVQGDNVRLRYFVIVATGTINQSAIDWNEWTTSLNNKVNTDGSNASFPYIVETYANGMSGYNLWSNNYCEQWGERKSLVDDEAITITLLKPYANTDYVILNAASAEAVVGKGGTSCVYSSKTTTSFVLTQDTRADNGGNWLTKGYIK